MSAGAHSATDPGVAQKASSPAQRPAGDPLTYDDLLREVHPTGTPHGLRSNLADWARALPDRLRSATTTKPASAGPTTRES